MERVRRRSYHVRAAVGIRDVPTRTSVEQRCLDPRTWALIVSQIEGIKQVYNFMNRFMSLGLEDRVRRDAVESLVVNTRLRDDGHRQAVVVDVGSGPGTSLMAIRRLLDKSFIVAVDPSAHLLSTACAGILCERVVGVVEHLPVRDRGADIVTSFYASRDFQSLPKALVSMLNVARRGLAIGDIFLPRQLLKRFLVRTWVCRIVPILALLLARRYWKNYKGLCITIKQWCDVGELGEYIERLSKRLNRPAIVKSRSYVLGGLGYVTAFFKEENTSRHNRS